MKIKIVVDRCGLERFFYSAFLTGLFKGKICKLIKEYIKCNVS